MTICEMSNQIYGEKQYQYDFILSEIKRFNHALPKWKEALKNHQKGVPISSFQTAIKYLLDRINDAITEENKKIADQGEDRFIELLDEPIPIIIATVFCALKTFRRIAEPGDEGHAVLAVYIDDPKSEKYGLFDPNPQTFKSLLMRVTAKCDTLDYEEIYNRIDAQSKTVEINRDPDIIPFKNGVLNYQTKKFYLFSPVFVLTQKLSVDFDPYAKSPVIKNENGTGKDWTFDTWFMSAFKHNPESGKIILKLIGASMRPFVPWRKTVLLYPEEGENRTAHAICRIINNVYGLTRHMQCLKKERFILLPDIHTEQIDHRNRSKKGRFAKTETDKTLETDPQYYRTYVNPDPLAIQCFNRKPDGIDSDAVKKGELLPIGCAPTSDEDNPALYAYLERDDVLKYIVNLVMLRMPNYDALPAIKLTDRANERLMNEENASVREFYAAFKEWAKSIQEIDNRNDYSTPFYFRFIPFTLLYGAYKGFIKMSGKPGEKPYKQKDFSKQFTDLMGQEDETMFEFKMNGDGRFRTYKVPAHIRQEVRLARCVAYLNEPADRLRQWAEIGLSEAKYQKYELPENYRGLRISK